MNSMKKISFFLIALSMTFASCENFLDESPSSKLPTNTAITSVTDLSNAINGVYYTLVNEQYGLAGDMFLYADLKGTDTKYISKGGHCSYLSDYQTSANDGHPDGFWSDIYSALGRANYAIEGATGMTVPTADQADYDDNMAELHAIRGWLHFQGAILFCQIPTVTGVDMNAANSGLPISDKVFPVAYQPTRATLTETYTFITSELETSLLTLSKDAKSGRINYWAAKAILSRVYLYMGNNNKALEYAADVIANSGKSLYTAAEYTSVWSQTFTKESLFELGVTDLTNAQRNSIGYYCTPEGYAECAATDAFFAYATADLADVRSTMIEQKIYGTKNQGYYTNKYPGQAGSTTPTYTNSPKIIRMSEVYLIAAEAAVKGGTATGAQSAAFYINKLRTNRIAAYADVPSVTLDDVMAERRLELAFEGHRFFDLVRNNITFDNPVVGSVVPTDYRVIMAIPQRERDIAPSLVQNPLY